MTHRIVVYRRTEGSAGASVLGLVLLPLALAALVFTLVISGLVQLVLTLVGQSGKRHG